METNPYYVDVLSECDPGKNCRCRRRFYMYTISQMVFGRRDDGFMEIIDKHIQDLFRNIWMASYLQELTPCILGALRACLGACKIFKSPSERLIQFYDLHLEGSSLPASIILHTLSRSIETSRVNVRTALLEMILKEVPLTNEARYELYMACTNIGNNGPFNYIDTVSSIRRKLQNPASPDTERTHVEIGKGLRLRAGFVEKVKVTSLSDGWLLEWFVPDMIQRLQSKMTAHTEFVVQDHVWSVSLAASTRESRLLVLGVSIVDSSEPMLLSGKLVVAPESHEFFRPDVSGEIAFDSYIWGAKTSHVWEFTRFAHKIWEHMNPDGRCYIKLRAVVKFRKLSRSLLFTASRHTQHKNVNYQ